MKNKVDTKFFKFESLTQNRIEVIYITQLVYVIKGEEKTFEEFENIAIPIIPKYHGSLLLRVRPDDNAFIDSKMEHPYEIHLVSFPTEDDFQNFMKDEERKQFLHLKEQSIRSSILYKGTQLGA